MVAGRKNYVENLKNMFPDDHEAIDKFMNILDVSHWNAWIENMQKCAFGYMRAANAQIGLRIRKIYCTLIFVKETQKLKGQMVSDNILSIKCLHYKSNAKRKTSFQHDVESILVTKPFLQE